MKGSFRDLDEESVKKSLVRWNKILLDIHKKLDALNEEFNEIYKDIVTK